MTRLLPTHSFSARVIRYTCSVCGVQHDELSSPKRSKRQIRARRMASLILRDYHPGTKMSYPRIARVVGMRSHCSVINQVRHARAMLRGDPRFAEDVKVVLQKARSPQ